MKLKQENTLIIHIVLVKVIYLSWKAFYFNCWEDINYKSIVIHSWLIYNFQQDRTTKLRGSSYGRVFIIMNSEICKNKKKSIRTTVFAILLMDGTLEWQWLFRIHRSHLWYTYKVHTFLKAITLTTSDNSLNILQLCSLYSNQQITQNGRNCYYQGHGCQGRYSVIAIFDLRPDTWNETKNIWKLWN